MLPFTMIWKVCEKYMDDKDGQGRPSNDRFVPVFFIVIFTLMCVSLLGMFGWFGVESYIDWMKMRDHPELFHTERVAPENVHKELGILATAFGGAKNSDVQYAILARMRELSSVPAAEPGG